MNSLEVTEAMERGVRRALPSADIISIPLSDGGDGLLETVQNICTTTERTAKVTDPIGRVISGRFLITNDRESAIIEMAEASGLRRVLAENRDPWNSSTFGTGQLILDAINSGARNIWIGVGGSATLDAGAGALAALGARFFDKNGRLLTPTPRGVSSLAYVNLDRMDSRLSKVNLLLLADVITPLAINVRTFGIQKGILPADFAAYDKVLKSLAACAELRGFNILNAPWCGAGGGLSGGLVSFAGAKVYSGAKMIARVAGLYQEIKRADLVITGEGRLDNSSFDGKLPLMVSKMASKRGIPCFILVGQIADKISGDIPEMTTIIDMTTGLINISSAITEAPARISDFCEQIGRAYAEG